MTALKVEDELPVDVVPAIDAWSENYCFEGYDAAAGIGFWLHMGRWAQDPHIWRERVLIYLPEGEFLVQRAWGATPAVNGVRGALLELTCEKPEEQWRLRYRGPVRRVTGAALASAPLVEGLRSLLDFDLKYSSAVPVWDFGIATREEVWCSAHYEQPGRVRGRFRFEGREFQMDGIGFRDHSRGPRNLSAWAGHCWIHGQFPGGRSFALFDTRKLVGGEIVTGIAKAVLWDGYRLVDARCADPPYLTSPEEPPETYEFKLASELGTMHIAATTLRTLPISTNAGVESFIGRVPADLALFTAYQQPSAFYWDECEGHGHTERSVLL